MDRLTKGVVIAACSVVIAAPIVWVGRQYLELRRQTEIQEQAQKAQEERNRRVSRAAPCKDRADELNPISLEQDTESMMAQIKVNSAFIARCVDSTKPVAEVK